MDLDVKYNSEWMSPSFLKRSDFERKMSAKLTEITHQIDACVALNLVLVKLWREGENRERTGSDGGKDSANPCETLVFRPCSLRSYVTRKHEHVCRTFPAGQRRKKKKKQLTESKDYTMIISK